MTKKQLKNAAKKIAALEMIIDANKDTYAVERAKEDMIKYNESLDLETEEMLMLDEMVSGILKNNLTS